MSDHHSTRSGELQTRLTRIVMLFGKAAEQGRINADYIPAIKEQFQNVLGNISQPGSAYWNQVQSSLDAIGVASDHASPSQPANAPQPVLQISVPPAVAPPESEPSTIVVRSGPPQSPVRYQQKPGDLSFNRAPDSELTKAAFGVRLNSDELGWAAVLMGRRDADSGRMIPYVFYSESSMTSTILSFNRSGVDPHEQSRETVLWFLRPQLPFHFPSALITNLHYGLKGTQASCSAVKVSGAGDVTYHDEMNDWQVLAHFKVAGSASKDLPPVYALPPFARREYDRMMSTAWENAASIMREKIVYMLDMRKRELEIAERKKQPRNIKTLTQAMNTLFAQYDSWHEENVGNRSTKLFVVGNDDTLQKQWIATERWNRCMAMLMEPGQNVQIDGQEASIWAAETVKYLSERDLALWMERRDGNTIIKTQPVAPAVESAPALPEVGQPAVESGGVDTLLTVTPDRDTRDNSQIWIARVPSRISREDYVRLRSAVKQYGGYWSSFKKGFLFKTDPTEKLKAAGLADEISTLCAMAMEEETAMGLGDGSGRLARLQMRFRKIVTMYAVALCMEKVNPDFHDAIDNAMSGIATNIELDYHLIKEQELDSCRSGEYGSNAAAGQSATEAEESTAQHGGQKLDPTERVYAKAEYMRHIMPYAMRLVSAEAETRLEAARETIGRLSVKPDTYEGTKESYLASIRTKVQPLIEEREAASKLFTGTRNKYQPNDDASETVHDAVRAKSEELYAQSNGGRLTQPAVEARLAMLDATMRESRFYEHFPTPLHIIDTMMQYANIRPGELVLEPSAGEGNIAAKVFEYQPEALLHVGEYEPLLQEILTVKGYDVVSQDFLAYNTDGRVRYNVIVMNPPFDKGVDIKHVQHAYKMLADGGRLVAITSANAVDGADEVNYAFRDFIGERGKYKLYSPTDYMGPAGKLTNGRQIGITTAMIMLTRPAGDTYGRKAVQTMLQYATEGNIIYDTQGATVYKIVAIIDDSSGRQTTHAIDMASNRQRVFNGVIRLGTGRFIEFDEEQAKTFIRNRGDGHDDGVVYDKKTGFIQLPKLPPPPPNGEVGLKPLRVVESRSELMPPAPSEILYNERLATFVTLTPGQLEGINRGLAAIYGPARTFLLADGTGFGKTLQELMIASTVALKDKRPALIFTKAPSIIETSFFPDAHKLRISTPGAQNPDDRKTWTKKDGSGLQMKRIRRMEDIEGKQLDPDTIYIASFHILGNWRGDKAKRTEMTDYKKAVINPLRAQLAEVKSKRTQGLDSKTAARIKRELQEAFDTSREMVHYRKLKEDWEKLNADYFSEIGNKFSIIVSDEAHGFKNYDPDDIEDGALQAFRGMVLYRYASRGMFSTATVIDKVEHIRYLRGLGVYKTEEQYMRMMAKMGFKWSPPEYKNDTLVAKGGFSRDEAMPPEYVLNNVSRLFENLTMAGTMIKRELSLDNFTAENVMIGGVGSSESERIAVSNASDILARIDHELKDKKSCKAPMVNEKKFALEPFKIPRVIEICKREILEGRQVVIFCTLVNDAGPSFNIEGKDKPCSVVDKPSTVNVLKRELGALFGPDQIGLVTGVIKSDEETLGDDGEECIGCSSDQEGGLDGLSDNQKQRNDDIRAFQEGRKRIIISTPEAGGTGISLDDTVGNAPRTVILMTAPFSSVEVVQIMGRINRAKTKSRQRCYFLWVDVPIDRRLRDIIATKLKMLGAAVQGEVKRVSVEEAEQATGETVQDNTDKHNTDRDGKRREHSMKNLQIIDGRLLPTNRPFVLTHKSSLTGEIEPDGQTRGRWRPIRMFCLTPKVARATLKEWLDVNKGLADAHKMTLETDRYAGPYIQAFYNDELWEYLLNWMKPENTRFTMTQYARLAVGDRVAAATDIMEAGAKAGMKGTVSRVWERKVKALKVDDGAPVVDATGNHVYHTLIDYQVEFDNGERANNLEDWEIMPESMYVQDQSESLSVFGQEASQDVIETMSDAAEAWQDDRPASLPYSQHSEPRAFVTMPTIGDGPQPLNPPEATQMRHSESGITRTANDMVVSLGDRLRDQIAQSGPFVLGKRKRRKV